MCLSSNLQLNGELDTKTGAPTFANAMIKFYYPDVCAFVAQFINLISSNYQSPSLIMEMKTRSMRMNIFQENPF